MDVEAIKADPASATPLTTQEALDGSVRTIANLANRIREYGEAFFYAGQVLVKNPGKFGMSEESLKRGVARSAFEVVVARGYIAGLLYDDLLGKDAAMYLREVHHFPADKDALARLLGEGNHALETLEALVRGEGYIEVVDLTPGQGTKA